MARKTQTKDAYWFKHDSNVRNDLKIVKLRREMGREASDVYFDILCILREQKDYKFPVKNIGDIAYDLRFEEEKLKKIVNDYELFQTKSGYFFSRRLLCDMEEWEDKKAKRRAAGSKGGVAKAKQNPSIATLLLEQNPSNALAIEKSIEEKRKEEEKRGKDKKKFTPPSIEEVLEYFTNAGYRADVAEKAFEYYDTAGWKDGQGKQVRNWKQKMISVWFKEENKYVPPGTKQMVY